MIVIDKFKIMTRKNEILNAVNAYHDISHIQDIDGLYKKMHKLAIKNIDPLGAIVIENVTEPLLKKINSSTIMDCNHIVLCILTIGDSITDIIEKLFDMNMFDEAIVLDAVSTSVLFNMGKQVYNQIFEFTKANKLGLTCRVAPGDGVIDIGFQKDIIQRFSEIKNRKFEMINDCIIKPFKTLTYVYGADAKIEINREDHNCKKCHNERCFMRNSSERTRGSFSEETMFY